MSFCLTTKGGVLALINMMQRVCQLFNLFILLILNVKYNNNYLLWKLGDTFCHAVTKSACANLED